MSHCFFPVTFLLCAVAVAQAPDRMYVLSAASTSNSGGLWLRDGHMQYGGAVQLQGLPADLTGGGSGLGGASCVVADYGSSLLRVGEQGPNGTSIELHVVQVTSPTTAVELGRAFVGTVAGATGGIEDLEALPDGDVLLCVDGLAAAPPLQGARLARWSHTTGAVTPIATTAPAGAVQCIAADPTGQTLWFHVRDAVGIQGTLYRAPIGGGTVTAVRGISAMTSLTTDVDGNLWGTGNTYQIELSPVDGHTLSAAILNVTTQGVIADPVSQRPVVAAADGSMTASLFFDGAQVLTGAPATVTGVAALDSHRAYGQRTDGVAAYDWVRTASTPAPGNTLLLRVADTAANPTTGLLFAAFGRGTGTQAGVQVLLDLPSTAFLGLMPTRTDTPLAIPGTAPLGLHLFLQAAFADAGAPQGLAATRGLEVTIRS